MLKGQSVIGRPVLSRQDGQRLDPLKDLVIGKDHSRIVALLIDEGGLFSQATVIPWENVVSFGKDAIVVSDSKAAVRADRFPAVKEILDHDDSLIGKHVYTEAGDVLGRVGDVYFDETSGEIEALDITGKFNAEAPEAVAKLDMNDVVSIGPDAVMVKTGAAAKLAAQTAPKPATPPSGVGEAGGQLK